jgi:hypothetical protein
MPAPVVTAGAILACTFGAGPSSLAVLPVRRVLVEGRPVAAITDIAPIVNIPPFGVCSSLANPTVAAASAVAGTLTPMPCMPAVPAPWIPAAPTTTVGATPVLTGASTCQCAYGGLISIQMPGALRTTA